ncbi:MAG: FKBP-type peptidyl-prolyl cis-trans isomerase [Lentisphaeria bacterium]|nr:FKBP-type peptidyl-prolyl cis-trans isomerase [Lentisphaeria bacterium]
MTRIILAMATMGLCVGAVRGAVAPDLSTAKAKVSYLIGRQMGDTLAGQELAGEIDLETLCFALRQAAVGEASSIDQAEARETMVAFGTRMREKVQQQRGVQGEVNRREGAAFLETNRAKADWQVTGSGLQYRVVRQGEGTKPALTDTVEVHYAGKLVNGDEFDSSYKRGAAAVFPLRNVIKGWQEALQMMAVGSKWELVIPADLAYGAQGKGREIGPDAVLCFDVELLDIKDQAEAPAPRQDPGGRRQ